MKHNISRRDFLKLAGVSLGTLAFNPYRSFEFRLDSFSTPKRLPQFPTSDIIGRVTDSAPMRKNYGSNPADIVAGIGPSIGPDHYEIGADVILQVMQKFGDESELFLKSHHGKIHFNLWETNRHLLNRAGVGQIEVSGLCTACNTSDWFSHRAEKGRTGRFGALICLD